MKEMVFSCLLTSIGYLEIFIAILFFLVFGALGNTKNGVPRNYPFIGMFPFLLVNIHRIHETITDVLSKTRGTFLLKGPWFTNMDMLGTVDPENVRYIMSTNFSNFPKGQEFKKIFDAFGDGIFNSDFDLWKKQSKYAKELMANQRYHKCLIKTINYKVKDGLFPILDFMAKEDRIFDLQDIFKRLTFDTICKVVTGFDPGCLSLEFPHIPFVKAMEDIDYAIVIRHLLLESIWKLKKWLGVGPEKKLSQAVEVVDQIIEKFIVMKHEELSKVAKSMQQQEDGFDLLTLCMVTDGERTTGLKFDNKYLRDTIFNFMFAGRDGVNSCLTWFIWLVFTHPEVEKNIKKELKAIIPVEEEEKLKLFTAEELKNVIYLHAVLWETMRLYPPVPFQHKTPQKPDILPSGHHVHPKMRLMFNLYAMGRMESIWGKDALEFKPERWISECGTIKHEPSNKFLIFGTGPRKCIGIETSLTQLKVITAAIVHNYEIKMVKGHDVSPNCSIILHMKHGFKVRVKKRWA